MSSQSSASTTPDRVSKVTFSPVSDSTGNAALIVTIKSVPPGLGEVPRIMETPKIRSSSLDAKRSSSETKRRTRSRTSPNNKSTMTDKREETSSGSQTVASASEVVSPKQISGVDVPPEMHRHYPEATSRPSTGSPCLKHAAGNITQKASTIESEKVSLCNSCSKSMLSYIFVVQDFLESLAKEIGGSANTETCIQCLREETRSNMSASEDNTTPRSSRSGDKKKFKTRPKESLIVEDSPPSKQKTRVKEPARDVRKYEETSEQLIQRSLSQHKQDQHGHVPSTDAHKEGSEVLDRQTFHTDSQMGDNQPRIFSHDHERKREYEINQGSQQRYQVSQDHQGAQHGHQGIQEDHQGTHEHHQSHQVPHKQGIVDKSYGEQEHPVSDSHNQHEGDRSSSTHRPHIEEESIPGQEIPYRRPIHRQRPDFMFNREDNTDYAAHVSSPFSDGVDGIVSTLSNTEREVYDAARNGAGWEGLSEAQERLVSSSSSPIPSEAYVTMCRNNAEALGCLVVGTSLLLSRTNRTLCVLVSDGVSNAFRGPLSSVFHVVQCVRAMDSLGTTKLALLEQPELGVSFEKLNVWRLVQFNKCVFLNPDTLVIQNCDELFCREELSAVADIGWPDCFNSGVFVFVPSIQTFWKLLEFADKRGSYDGGDQGLLNSYFDLWSEDIGKKLSFIYNLMANVSYTYTPAFRQFGRNVKVVQFYGSFKPWHVKFYSKTGQISSETAVHPTYIQFVHIWINIFRISALRQLPQDIKSYAQTQDLICAVELLRFFPLPTESEAEFFLTPPSVRLQLAERKLQKTVLQHREEAQRRKSAEFLTRVPEDVRPRGEDNMPRDIETSPASVAEVKADTKDEAVLETVPKEEVAIENPLPGAEVGNYQGMKAWEQGRMDYQGTDSSDTIIKRLEFLMSQPK